MPKTKYRVEFQGAVFTRSTHRTYTHLVAIQDAAGAWHAVTWCGRPDLARAAVVRYQRVGRNAQVVPVTEPAALS